jgi:hypothetical protein
VARRAQGLALPERAARVQAQRAAVKGAVAERAAPQLVQGDLVVV